ncbi:MAG: leucine-rich repeat protein [Oscillospiraceae bacterium]|nr:leucine-rich repeat protein [Oscillospiraceae bacterium]
MKKYTAIFLSVIFMLILWGCKKIPNPNTPSNATTNSSSVATIPNQSTIPDDNVEDNTNETIIPPTTEATEATKATEATTATKATSPTVEQSCAHLWGQWVDKIKATCETGGETERVCHNCHITESQKTEKTGHKESDWIVDKLAKVGENGLEYTKCLYCNKRINEKTIPAITEDHQHTTAKWVTVKEANCTNPGTRNALCSCGKIIETEKTPAKGHTSVVDKAVAASCKANGLTEGAHCSVCNTVLVAQTVVVTNGHSISSKTVAATATKGAHRLYSCANCTYSYEEPIDLANLLKFESNNNGTCTVTGLKDNTVTDLVIPEKSPAGDTVVAIGSEAFKKCESIVYLELPDSITNIKYDAFYYCNNLKTVVFPQNGTENLVLGLRCFAFCGIENLDLTKTTLETVGNHAFYGNKSLKTVKLGAVTTIDDFAFANCSELTSLIHAGSLVKIGERAFERCTKLTELRAQNSPYNLDTVEQFSSGAFCFSGIRDVVFSSNVKAINSSFNWCSNLGTVDFSRISGKFTSFIGCKIDKLIFPSNITRIPIGCFRGTTIGSLELPDSVVEIGSEAFCEATVGKITFGSGLTKIGAHAFKDAKATYDLSKVRAALTIEYEAFANNTFTSFAFPETTVFIGQGALMGCTKLQTLSIPFIAKDTADTVISTDCFAWLFGRNIDCWDQEDAVPKSLKTVILHGENPGNRAFFTVQITDLVIGKDITSFGSENFEAYSSSLKRVYYEGTQQEWNNVEIKTLRNQKLINAEKYFYSETEPTTEGNFWHYNANGVVTIW